MIHFDFGMKFDLNSPAFYLDFILEKPGSANHFIIAHPKNLLVMIILTKV